MGRMRRSCDPRLLAMLLLGSLSHEEAVALLDAQEAKSTVERGLPAQLADAPHAHAPHYLTDAQQLNPPPGMTGAMAPTSPEFIFTTTRG
jgi:hypothetical protein